MNSRAQTVETVQSDFDRIALLPEEPWDHNAHYHPFLLSQVPDNCDHALDIGCGTGRFSRLLATRAAKVLAIDLSPEMIRVARENSLLSPIIDFVSGDVLEYPLPSNHFDFIATLTTLHHLPLAAVLNTVKQALKAEGTFVCLDLYQRSTVGDLFFDAVSYPSSRALRLIKMGRLKPSAETHEAYQHHGETDSYLTLHQVAETCKQVIPGAIVRRHLFWRYSICWKKPLGTKGTEPAKQA